MRLSVITVSFNAAACIERTIRSVLNQTVPVFEYILVDGGSTDDTYRIICGYEKEFEARGIRYLHHSEKDRGISDAFNKGIARATGDVVGIINADDELMPDANEILCAAARESDAGVYYGNCLWVDETRGTEHVSYPRHRMSKLLYNMILIHPSTFVRRDVYRGVGVFDVSYRYCMDKELLYRFYRAGVRFQYVDAVLTKFKAGGVSDANPRRVFREESRMELENGEPWLKVKAIEYKKLARDWTVRKIKRTALYDLIKRTKKL